MSVARLALLFIVAAASAAAQSLPPIRDLGPAVATTPESFRGMPSVRALSDGRVLISDLAARKLVAYDSGLTKSTAYLTANGPVATQYPSRGGVLIPLPGDTTLVFDAMSASFVVIDPRGQVSRVISMPRTYDAYLLSAPQFYGLPVIDQRMRMIYRTRM